MIPIPPRPLLNRAHPLARKLAASLVPDGSRLRDTLSGAVPATTTGTFSYGVAPYGRGIRHTTQSDTDSISYDNQQLLSNLKQEVASSASAFSFVLLYTYIGFVNNAAIVSRYVTGIPAADWGISQKSNGGQAALAVLVGTSQYILGVFNSPHVLNQQYVLTFSKSTNANAPCRWTWSRLPGYLLQTVAIGGGSTDRSTSTSGSLVLFNTGGGGAFSSASSITGFHVWNRALTDKEHFQLQVDPWRMYRSPGRTLRGSVGLASHAYYYRNFVSSGAHR